MPQGLCTCSLYLKCAFSLFTYIFPLILQNRFWPGLLPQGRPHWLGQIHLLTTFHNIKQHLSFVPIRVCFMGMWPIQSESCAYKSLMLGLMRCSHHLEILNVWTRDLAFSFVVHPPANCVAGSGPSCNFMFVCVTIWLMTSSLSKLWTLEGAVFVFYAFVPVPDHSSWHIVGAQ